MFCLGILKHTSAGIPKSARAHLHVRISSPIIIEDDLKKVKSKDLIDESQPKAFESIKADPLSAKTVLTAQTAVAKRRGRPKKHSSTTKSLAAPSNRLKEGDAIKLRADFGIDQRWRKQESFSPHNFVKKGHTINRVSTISEKHDVKVKSDIPHDHAFSEDIEVEQKFLTELKLNDFDLDCDSKPLLSSTPVRVKGIVKAKKAGPRIRFKPFMQEFSVCDDSEVSPRKILAEYAAQCAVGKPETSATTACHSARPVNKPNVSEEVNRLLREKVQDLSNSNLNFVRKPSQDLNFNLPPNTNLLTVKRHEYKPSLLDNLWLKKEKEMELLNKKENILCTKKSQQQYELPLPHHHTDGTPEHSNTVFTPILSQKTFE